MSQNKCWGKCIVTRGSHIEMRQTIMGNKQTCAKTRDMVKKNFWTSISQEK